MSRTENLTIMFTDMVGFTERTSRQSREQNKYMLQEQERLLLPVVARFGGRHIKSIGDAFLITFRSPTDAVRCGMALHDILAEFNAGHADLEQIHIRVAINVGEVRMEGRDVFGEPVNVAARVEGITPADEIYFTEAVYLAMNKAEVPSEPLGSQKLKGIPEEVKLFRVPSHQINRLVAGGENMESAPGELPFGGMHRLSQPRTSLIIFAERIRQIPYRIRLSMHASPFQIKTLWLGVALLFALCVLLGWWKMESSRQAVSERSAATIKLVQDGHAAFAQGKRSAALKNYESALMQNPALQSDPLMARNLVEDLGGANDPAATLIRKYPNPNIIDALAQRATQPGAAGRQRATALLNELGHGNKIDRTLVAIADLQGSQKCENKLAAIKRLRKLRDVRALPALKRSKGEGIEGWWKNRCLRDEADAAIQEIERQTARP